MRKWWFLGVGALNFSFCVCIIKCKYTFLQMMLSLWHAFLSPLDDLFCSWCCHSCSVFTCLTPRFDCVVTAFLSFFLKFFLSSIFLPEVVRGQQESLKLSFAAEKISSCHIHCFCYSLNGRQWNLSFHAQQVNTTFFCGIYRPCNLEGSP